MIRPLIAICALLLASAAHAQTTQPAWKQWKVIWSDDFDGNQLDSTKWSIGLPWSGTDGEGRHHNDQYASYIMDHNVVVEDGKLKLLTRREDVTDKKGRTFHFTQGLITSSKNFRHRYGYWEARVKIPVEAGPGLWPAFWTLSEGWPPEMDICEVWTSTNRNHQGLCYRPAGGGKEKWDDIDRRDKPLPVGFNTFAMEWGPGYQFYYFNGQVTKRIYGDHVTADKHYILLNSGVDARSLPTPATLFPNAFEVDYVRVYERPDLPALHNPSFEDNPVSPWTQSGRVIPVAFGAHSGQHALRLDAGPATSEQKIYGLRKGATYVLTAWVKPLTDNTPAQIGIKNYDGDDKFTGADAKSNEYQQLRLEFTPTGTTAIIYCSLPDKTGAALFDDIELQIKD